jgi:acyl dehydratase
MKAGDVLPRLEKRVDVLRAVAYAAATWDFHRYHYDPQFVVGLGLERPFADGQMFGGFLAQMVNNWAGVNAFIRKLNLTYISIVPLGETVSCEGEVSAVDESRTLVHLTVRVVGQDGREVVSGTAAVEMGTGDGIHR